jgi:hypothetical protein
MSARIPVRIADSEGNTTPSGVNDTLGTLDELIRN